ncbi:DUF3077 domain-containing protein [Pseudomonas shirazensis]|uniref:DUF3077 domain-containing protein n=1 Tax=Pseudomonas shirazensis TaxID=2745494 RepID=UPI003D274CDA
MDTQPPQDTGKPGLTVGSATCLDGAGNGQRLFRTEPGNCCMHALEQASMLLASARRASFLGVMDDEPELVWASHFLGQMAKALIDDANIGLHKRS